MKRIISRTRAIYVMKTISSNKIPFIVLFIFSCFATALYTGIGWSGSSMEKSVCGYCEEGNMFDISVMSPNGLTQEDIDSLLTLDDVDEAEGCHFAYGFFENGGNHFSAKVYSITEKIAVSSVVKGTLPENADEIAVEAKWAELKGISVGDVISVDKESQALIGSKFTVTALVENPVCVYPATSEKMAETGAPVEIFLFLNPEAFRSSLVGGYEQIYLRSDSLRQFELGSDDYTLEVNKLKEKVASDYYYVQTATETESLTILSGILDLFNRFHYSVSIPFVFVCIAISVAVILRLTSEDAAQIGLQLAMGATDMEITHTYLMFILVPVAFGSVLGTVLGCFIGESLVIGTISGIWVIEKMIYAYNYAEAICLVLAIIVLIIVAVVVSSRFVQKRGPVSLLNGPADPMLKPAFYEKTKLWKKLTLLTKCIVNNMRIDRMRVRITLMGIIGCTMLAVSGFYTLRSVKAGFAYQFDELQGFETVVYFDSKSDAGEKITEKLSEKGVATIPVYMESGFLHASDGKMIPSVIIVSDEKLDGWMDFYSKRGEVEQSADEVLLSCPFADYYDTSEGSILTFTDALGGEFDVEIGEVFDYYLACQQLVFSSEKYEKITGRTVKNNTILLAKNNLSVSETDSLLRDIDGYYNVDDYKTNAYKGYEMYLNLTAGIAGILIVISFSLVFFMLINLFVQFINEKKREIIILRINGYSLSYVRRYIYLDTIVLGAIGIVLGAIFGNLLGVVNVNMACSGCSYFPQSFDIVACFEGMGISAVFTALMCLRALKQIGKLGIADMNKA